MKSLLSGAVMTVAVLLVPTLSLAGPNCTNTCTRACGQLHNPDSLNYGICFEGCIHGCVYGPEAPTVPEA